jgi:2-polyprenyl-3-methyl-5-hydroxy-6-metoxy-1,4-benzoquinol methylase
MKNNKIKSPLDSNSQVEHLFDLSTKKLIKEYRRFNINTSILFKDIEIISAYKCTNTGYKFYYPPIQGDSKFYEECSMLNWYYVPWKWEHAQVLNLLNQKDKILEIGSGNSGFIRGLFKKNIFNCTGLELNEQQVAIAKSCGLNVLNESIETHSSNNSSCYDVVCSFQVLEHVYDVNLFIKASVDALKIGGKLIISVPNNGSYVYDSKNIFNSPPHHLGMWDEFSLSKLAKIFNLQLDSIFIEPLQDHHKNFFFHVAYKNTFHFVYKFRLLRKIFELTIGKYLINNVLNYTTQWIPGHTIMAVYTKKS